MADSSDIEASFTAFLTGRLPFDDLVKSISAFAASHPMGQEIVAETIRNLVNTGRLPADLANMVAQNISVSPSTPPEVGSAVDYDEDDPPTIPRPRTSDMPPLPHTSVDGEGDPLRNKVDDVVLSAIADKYAGFREGRSAEPSRDERELGSLLRDMQGMRVRRDADRAKEGRTKPIDLESQRGDRKKLAIGSYIKDRFVIDRVLGSGGMSTVYAAIDRRRLEAAHDNPYVAVKVLAESLKRNPYALQLLEAETRKAQALAHPNIVTVFDFDRDQSDVFIVMEMLEGKSLADLLQDDSMRYSTLDLAQPVLSGTISALAYAHSQSVVHADVKPANIFVSSDGRAKVLDFGIASGIDPAELNAFTRTYASPEMIEGKGRDPKDDVYSLGCVAYLMLTGTHPYKRKTADAARDEGLRPTRLSTLTKRQWDGLDASLAFERKHRPSMEELGELLFTTPKSFLGRLFGR